jgi:hypothetical protein
MMQNSKGLSVSALLLGCIATLPAQAAPALFQGNSYTFTASSFSTTTESQPLNALQAQRAFFGAAPGAQANTITFDSITTGQNYGASSAALNSDVSLAVTGTGGASGISTTVRNTTSAGASQQTQAGWNVTGGTNGGPQALSGTTLGNSAYSDVVGTTRNYLFSNLSGSTNTYTLTYTFTFTQNVNSFGFFVTGLGNVGTAITPTFTGFNGASQIFSYNLNLSSLTNGGYEFAGVTSTTPLNRVVLTFGAGSVDNFGIDDISYTAAAVPEPEFAIPLMAIAVPFGVFVGLRKRRL